MGNLIKYALTITLMLSLQACSTLGDAKRAQGEGIKRTYSVGLEKAWEASEKALNKLNLDIASQNKSEGYILAQRSMTAFSYGENIALFIKSKSPSNTEVEIVSKRAMSTNIFAPDWSEDIHREIALSLEKK
jgi:hypothetical protein